MNQMSKTRKIILISLINITIILWLTFIYTVFTHEEDQALINYKTLTEDITPSKKPEIPKDPPKENDNQGF